MWETSFSRSARAPSDWGICWKNFSEWEEISSWHRVLIESISRCISATWWRVLARADSAALARNSESSLLEEYAWHLCFAPSGCTFQTPICACGHESATLEQTNSLDPWLYIFQDLDMQCLELRFAQLHLVVLGSNLSRKLKKLETTTYQNITVSISCFNWETVNLISWFSLSNSRSCASNSDRLASMFSNSVAFTDCDLCWNLFWASARLKIERQQSPTLQYCPFFVGKLSACWAFRQFHLLTEPLDSIFVSETKIWWMLSNLEILILYSFAQILLYDSFRLGLNHLHFF